MKKRKAPDVPSKAWVRGKCLGEPQFQLILKEFDLKANNLTLSEARLLHAASLKKFTFMCEVINCEGRCEHRWITSLNARTRKSTKCPFCVRISRNVFCKCNSLAGKFSELNSRNIFWDKDANDMKQFDPLKIGPGSDRTVHWICKNIICENECVHKFGARPSNIVRFKHQCPYCSIPPKAFCGCHSVRTVLLPSLAQVGIHWNEGKNSLKNLDPSSIAPNSPTVAHWKCDKITCEEKCPHEWERAINSLKGCPFCSKRRLCQCRRVSKRFDQLKLRNIEWDVKKNKEIKLDPDLTSDGTAKKAWWICSQVTCEKSCLHSFQAPIVQIIQKSSCCPFCSKPVPKALCKCKVVGSHLSVLEKRGIVWHEDLNSKNEIDMWKIGARSPKKAFFYCRNTTCESKCEHVWFTQIFSVVSGRSGCPYCCTPAQKFCECNSLAGLYPTLISTFWDFEENDLLGIDPWNVAKKCNDFAHWKCQKCQWKFTRRINDQTNREVKHCPKCNLDMSVMEHLMNTVLLGLKNQGMIDSFETQKTLVDLVWRGKLYLDFYAKVSYLKNPVAIETDGQQHFQPFIRNNLESINNWHRIMKRDAAKNEHLHKQQIHLLRLSFKIAQKNYANEVEKFLREAQECEKMNFTHHKFLPPPLYQKQKTDLENLK